MLIVFLKEKKVSWRKIINAIRAYNGKKAKLIKKSVLKIYTGNIIYVRYIKSNGH